MIAGNQINTNDYIWPNFPCKAFSQAGGAIQVEEAPRSDGNYVIGLRETGALQAGDVSPSVRVRLTTLLIDLREQGNIWPKVTTALIEEAKNAPCLSVHRRADRLLRYLSNLTSVVGDSVSLGTPAAEPDPFGSIAISEGPTFWGALAWSESLQIGEIRFLMDYLRGNGWIKWQGDVLSHFTVTVDGYSHIADQTINIDSSQVFVAMWFDESMDDAFNRGIRLAVENAGYDAFKISDKPDVDKIDDEIIGEIRRSRFMVADFTHGDRGARGSVYYEAGFAYGLGLPVLRSCRKDIVDRNELHFDVRQHYHVVWETPEELRDGLEKRIRALIGEGSKARQAR